MSEDEVWKSTVPLNGEITLNINSVDEKVAVDTDATSGYLGAAYNDGVLRTNNTYISYTDGGDYIVLSIPDNAITEPKLNVHDSPADGEVLSWNNNGYMEWIPLPASSDDKYVAVDSEATPGYLGTTGANGVLRTSSPLTYTDGGNYVTLGIFLTPGDIEGLVTWGTFTADDGSTSANVVGDTLTITGENDIVTSISGDTLTISSLATIPDTGLIWIDPVLDKDLNDPPGGESEGDRYIIASASNWYDPSYQYRRLLTTDNTKVATDETDAVISVEINGADDIFSNAQADGDDIVFCDSDGITKLNHDIERFDAVNQIFVARVKIPALDGDAGYNIYCYYGNASTGNQENVTGTYPASYGIFYDMRDGSGYEGIDNTSNARNIYAIVDDPAASNGNYGYGTLFDGTNDAYNMKDIAYFEQAWSTRTHNIIFKTGADITTRQALIAEGGGTNGCMLYIYDSNLYARWWSESKGWSGDHLVTDGNISTDTVYYVTMMYDNGNEYQLWINGVEHDAGAHSATVDMNAHSGDGGVAYTGSNTKDFHDTTTSGCYFNGEIYEFFVCSDAWDINRHTTWYNHRSDNASFWTIGTEQSQSGGALNAWAGHDGEVGEANKDNPAVEADWDFTVPTDGVTCWVSDENAHYTYDDPPGAWSLYNGAIAHSALSAVQGGGIGPPIEQYHMTLSQWTASTRDATNDYNGLMPAGKYDEWDLGYLYRLEAIDTDSGTVVSSDARITVTGTGGITTSGSGDTLTIDGSGIITNVTAFFGDGSHGDVTISTNTLINQDMFYDNLTINNGITLYTGGFRVYVRDTLTFNGSSSIKALDPDGGTPDGAPASGMSLGAGGVHDTPSTIYSICSVVAGGDGGSGEDGVSGGIGNNGHAGGAGIDPTKCMFADDIASVAGTAGGAGGADGGIFPGGTGGVGGAAGAQTSSAATHEKVRSLPRLELWKHCELKTVNWQIFNISSSNGASGGGGSGAADGGGADSGGGGGGGASGLSCPPMFVAARYTVTNGSSDTIDAAGQNGGDGGAGGDAAGVSGNAGGGGGGAGGSGGNGGVLVFVYEYYDDSITLAASEGTGGTGGTGGAGYGSGLGGNNGNNGNNGSSGVIITFKV